MWGVLEAYGARKNPEKIFENGFTLGSTGRKNGFWQKKCLFCNPYKYQLGTPERTQQTILVKGGLVPTTSTPVWLGSLELA